MKERVWVIAGNVFQFNDYVKDKPLNGDKKYAYVTGPQTLRGFTNPHGVFIGSWKHRDDIIQILDQLIISTNVASVDNLIKMRTDLIRNATPAVMHSASLNQAAQMLSKAIDQELMDQLIGKKPTVFDIMEEFDTPMTWKGFVK